MNRIPRKERKGINTIKRGESSKESNNDWISAILRAQIIKFFENGVPGFSLL